MNALLEFLRNLFLRAPLEFLLALLRLLLFLLLLIPILLLKLWEWIRWLLRTENPYPEQVERDCGKLPEAIIRRPDPAIYSQRFLQSQGLPVTWNNPDIWVAPAANPAAIEPDSYHLKADTDYVATVQAHNASTDAAIGVQVRLVYRPWSFDSPDLIPVEIDALGDEVVRIINIPPMGSALAQFQWHTPPVAPGESRHFCLQAILSHPLDINPANNMGQENTNVHGLNPGTVAAGETLAIEVPLFNARRRAEQVRFRWDAYQIDAEQEFELRLQVARGTARLPLSARLAHTLPTVLPAVPSARKPEGRTAAVVERGQPARAPLFGRIGLRSPKASFELTKTRYTGFEALREQLLKGDFSLPAGMTVQLEGEAEPTLRLQPRETRTTSFAVKIPDDAEAGARLPMNILAETEDGLLLGGVTLYFDVRE